MSDVLDLFMPPVDPAIDALHQATAYYTSEPIVSSLLDLVQWPHVPGKLLDPGAGSGNFVVQALKRLTLLPNDIEALAARLEAWEIYPLAAEEARERVSAHLRTQGWTDTAAAAGARAVVHMGDFLLDGPRTPVARVALANPPFLRQARLPVGLRERYAAVVPNHARADLLHAFLDQMARALTPDGVLAAVTSDRWLFNENAAGLRAVIGATFGISSCERLDCDSAFYRAKTRRAGTPPRVHPVAIALAPRASALIPLTRAPYYPGGEAFADVAGTPLGELATVRLAPWMGPDGVFVLAQGDAAHLPADVLVPCVDMADITQGRLGAPTRFALRTTRAEPGDAVRAHVLATRHLLPPRARQEPFWLVPESWGELPYHGDALLIPRIAKGLVPVHLPAGVLPINHNVAIIAASPDRLAAIEAAMRLPSTQAWVQAHAPRLENGYFSLTVRLLRQLPLVLDEATSAEAA